MLSKISQKSLEVLPNKIRLLIGGRSAKVSQRYWRPLESWTSFSLSFPLSFWPSPNQHAEAPLIEVLSFSVWLVLLDVSYESYNLQLVNTFQFVFLVESHGEFLKESL